MHILTGSHRFRARETSGGYKHPHQVQGLVPPRFIPGESPSSAASFQPTMICKSAEGNIAKHVCRLLRVHV